MGDYIIGSDGELYHYGIKGMKWGIRRYQNKDGSLTPAGKKRLTKEITSKKTSAHTAEVRMRYSVDSVKEFKDYRNSEKFQNAVKQMNEYRQEWKEHCAARDRARWDAAAIAEKKYGNLEDLENRGDTKAAAAYRKEFDKHFDRRKFDIEEQRLNRKLEAAIKARESVQTDVHSLLDGYLGKYANVPLKGVGSAIWKGGKVVDRTRVNEIITDAMTKELLFKHFSLEDRPEERRGFDFLG